MNYEQKVAMTTSQDPMTLNVHMHLPKIDTTTSLNDYVQTKRRNAEKEEARKAQIAHDKTKIELEIATDPIEAEYRIKDRILAKKIGLEFIRHYPGHGWEVHSDIQNGIVNIFNRHMSALHGYRIKTQNIRLTTLSRDVKRIGGEILERFGLSRERFDADHIRDIQRRTRGRAKADLS